MIFKEFMGILLVYGEKYRPSAGGGETNWKFLHRLLTWQLAHICLLFLNPTSWAQSSTCPAKGKATHISSSGSCIVHCSMEGGVNAVFIYIPYILHIYLIYIYIPVDLHMHWCCTAQSSCCNKEWVSQQSICREKSRMAVAEIPRLQHKK